MAATADPPFGGDLFDHRSHVQSGQSRLRFVVTENQDAAALRINCRMIRGRNAIFPTIACSDHERNKPRGMEQFTNSLNHIVSLDDPAIYLKGAA